jgi:hypothetical protein
MRHTTRTTSYLLRPLGLLMLAALAASVMMVVVLASPAHANNLTVIVGPDEQNTNGECSLREAIINANQNDQSGSTDCAAGEGEDTISISGTGATLALTSQLPPITDAAGLTIEGNMSTIDGQNKVRVFEVASGAELTLNNLTVANGRADNAGGGILNLGTLEVNNSTISGNRAGTFSGGIHNVGTLTVNNSTISGNRAGTFSGGIHNVGTLTVNSSTISGNSAGTDNGGIGNASAGTLTVNNSTISGNSANNNGGGIGNGSTATLNNTIVANNEGGNCAGLPVTDDGGNLEWPGNDCGFALSADPLLGPLADNGGPTQTHALQPDSPAIDAAVECPPPATDQRGVSRPQGDACDIGSFELEKLDTEAPKVISTFPRNGGEVGPAVNVTATFSEDMQEASVINAFKLFRKGSTNQIAATVTYDAMTDIATLNPTNNLRRGVTYKAVVTTVAKDEAGNRLDQNDSRGGLQQKVWFFEIDN